MLARQAGKMNDPESGLPHLAHALVDLTFVLWGDVQAEGKKEEDRLSPFRQMIEDMKEPPAVWGREY